MDKFSTPIKNPHTETPCCSPTAAWQWVNAVAEMAVYGDDDAHRWLPVAVDHALKMGRAVGAA